MDNLTTKPKTFSICMSIQGFLLHNKFPRDYVNMFEDNGKTLTPEEARSYLQSELDKGRKVIPASAECGNPCAHVNNGCTGFDYAGGGCPGRYVNKTAE